MSYDLKNYIADVDQVQREKALRVPEIRIGTDGKARPAQSATAGLLLPDIIRQGEWQRT